MKTTVPVPIPKPVAAKLNFREVIQSALKLRSTHLASPCCLGTLEQVYRNRFCPFTFYLSSKGACWKLLKCSLIPTWSVNAKMRPQGQILEPHLAHVLRRKSFTDGSQIPNLIFFCVPCIWRQYKLKYLNSCKGGVTLTISRADAWNFNATKQTSRCDIACDETRCRRLIK